MRIGFAILRVAAAVAGVAAIVGQLVTSLDFWPKNGVTNLTLSVTNFFSFFTIQSNVAAIAVFLIGAVILVIRKGEDPAWFNTLRTSIVTYMVVTGIVYNLLLRNVELPQGATLGWSNEILHVWVPVLMLLDWLFTPGRVAVPWKKLWLVVIYPIAWAAYTMVRGPFTPNEVSRRVVLVPVPVPQPRALRERVSFGEFLRRAYRARDCCGRRRHHLDLPQEGDHEVILSSSRCVRSPRSYAATVAPEPAQGSPEA